jgi:hypothetical protein
MESQFSLVKTEASMTLIFSKVFRVIRSLISIRYRKQDVVDNLINIVIISSINDQRYKAIRFMLIDFRETSNPINPYNTEGVASGGRR